MSRLARFHRLFRAAPSRARKPRRRGRASLAVEALEDRLVPTVAFKPFFGTGVTNFGGKVLPSSDIYPIFWGDWWGSHPDEVAKLTAAFDHLVNYGPNDYLAATTQYGTDGKVKFHDTYHNNYIVDTSSNPPAQVDTGNIALLNFSFLSNEIEDLIYDAHAVPSPEDLHCDPLYVVVTPPGVTSMKGGEGGFNLPGLHHLYDTDFREEVWVSTQPVNPDSTKPFDGYDPTKNPLNLDYSSSLFGHEVVEAITSPFGDAIPGLQGGTVSPGLNWVGGGDDQLADFEPDANYFYRVGGPGGSLAQAYWSFAAGQFVVPDGNSLVMQLQPNWVGSVPNAYVTEYTTDPVTKHTEAHLVLSQQGSIGTLQGGTLVINADQPNIPRDFVGDQQIVIDTVQMPNATGVGVTTGVEVTMDGQTFDFENADFSNGGINDIQVNAANDTERILVKGTLANVPVSINLGSGNYTVNLGTYSDHALQGDVRINDYLGGNGVVKIDPDVPGAANVVVANSNGNLDVQLEPTGHNLAYLRGQVNVYGGGHTSIEVHDELNGLPTAYALTTGGPTLLTTSANPTFALWYMGATTVSIAGGFGADTYNLSGWVPGQNEQHLSIQAGGSPGTGRSSGASTLIVPSGTGTAITDNVTFDARSADLTLDDSGAGAAGTYTVTTGAVTRDAQGHQPLIQASNFTSLTLWTGPAADVVNVQSTQIPTTVISDLGFDQFKVSGTRDLTVDNHASVGAPTYTITDGTVTRDGHGHVPFITVHYGSPRSLTLDTGSTADTVNVESIAVPTTVVGGGGAGTFNVGLATHCLGLGDVLTLDGGTGGAALTVYDQAHANRYPATYTVTSTSLTRGEDEPPPKGVIGLPQWETVTINYAHLTQLELDASDPTSNVINVESTSASAAVYGGAGTTQVNVAPTSRNLDDIGAMLKIWNVPGTVTLNDQANPDGRLSGVPTTYDVSDYTLRRTATYRGGNKPGVTSVLIYGNEGFTLNTSTSAPNKVTLSNEYPVTLDAGAADAITVGTRYGGQGPLTVNAHGGTLHVDDASENGTDDVDVYTTGFTITDQAVTWREHEHGEQLEEIDQSDEPDGKKAPPPKLVATDSDFGGVINYTNVSALRIDGGAVDSTFTVWSTPAGTPLTINTTAGDRPQTRLPRLERERPTINQFLVGGGTAENIHSRLTLNGSGPNDTLLVDDSKATTQDQVTVTPMQVGTAASDEFFAAGGSLTYGGLSALTLNLSHAAGDKVVLTPSTGTAFTINGDPTEFQAGQGAELDFVLAGITDDQLMSTGSGAGTLTFRNNSHKTVNFTDMRAG
jgi:hypothetical protein